jgi:hypothetical protein
MTYRELQLLISILSITVRQVVTHLVSHDNVKPSEHYKLSSSLGKVASVKVVWISTSQ